MGLSKGMGMLMNNYKDQKEFMVKKITALPS